MHALLKLRRKMKGTEREEALSLIRDACAEYLAGPLKKAGAALSNPGAVASFARVKWAEERIEVFGLLLVDSRNRVTRALEMSRGTVDRAAVFPREVVFAAIKGSAAGVIAVHNHPSGVPDPSPEDRRLTGEIRRALDAAGVRFLDHVIVGREGCFSFRENGGLD